MNDLGFDTVLVWRSRRPDSCGVHGTERCHHFDDHRIGIEHVIDVDVHIKHIDVLYDHDSAHAPNELFRRQHFR